MPIEKWISFSLDGVWAEWCFRRHARRRINVDLVIFPKLQWWERPLYLNPHARVNTILTYFGRSLMPDPRTQARVR